MIKEKRSENKGFFAETAPHKHFMQNFKVD
jgi:hypothetical protein